MHCMISHRQSCRKKETAVSTETGNLWGSEWEREEGEKKVPMTTSAQSQMGRAANETWWDAHECHSSCTGADGCYLLWAAVLNVALWQTACFWNVNLPVMAEQLPPSSADVGWTAAFGQTQHLCDGRRTLFSLLFLLILTHTTVCVLHSTSNPMPKSRLQRDLQPIWPFWSKRNVCVIQANEKHLCKFHMRLRGFGIRKCLQTCCRDTKGAIMWTPPFCPHRLASPCQAWWMRRRAILLTKYIKAWKSFKDSNNIKWHFLRVQTSLSSFLSSA